MKSEYTWKQYKLATHANTRVHAPVCSAYDLWRSIYWNGRPALIPRVLPNVSWPSASYKCRHLFTCITYTHTYRRAWNVTSAFGGTKQRFATERKRDGSYSLLSPGKSLIFYLISTAPVRLAAHGHHDRINQTTDIGRFCWQRGETLRPRPL